MADVSKIQLPSGDTYDIVDSKSGYITGMTILSYGNSTWQDFINAYNSNKVVYCRASSNSNPASGSQTRLAFMAYVSNETTPTNVEFQYYRSVSSHTASQQGDQVYVYKLTNAGVWSVTVREASVKVAVGGDLTGSYSNGTYTVSATIPDVSGLAPLASPAFTGTPTAPTPTSGDDSTKIATTAFVQDAMSAAGAGTVTSVAVSNATNGGLSVSGSPITSSGTISIGHSNVLTSVQTTQAVYPIKIDKNGHISAYGSAVTITDEKLKTSAIGVSTTTYYPVLTTNASAAETKKYSTLLQARYKDSNYDIFNLRVGNGVGVKGRLQLSNSGSSGDFTTLTPNATGDTAITLPSASGTLALTSDIPTVPTNVSAFTNDAGYLTSYTETDPTVPSWAKAASKPTYTASEVGALPTNAIADSNTTGISVSNHSTTTIYGVQSSTTSVTGVQATTTTASKASGANSTTPSLTMAINGADTKQLDITFSTGTASTWSFSDVTVPIKATSATTVPIKDTNTTTVVTSGTHTVTDNGHGHNLVIPL